MPSGRRGGRSCGEGASRLLGFRGCAPLGLGLLLAPPLLLRELPLALLFSLAPPQPLRLRLLLLPPPQLGRPARRLLLLLQPPLLRLGRLALSALLLLALPARLLLLPPLKLARLLLRLLPRQLLAYQALLLLRGRLAHHLGLLELAHRRLVLHLLDECLGLAPLLRELHVHHLLLLAADLALGRDAPLLLRLLPPGLLQRPHLLPARLLLRLLRQRLLGQHPHVHLRHLQDRLPGGLARARRRHVRTFCATSVSTCFAAAAGATSGGLAAGAVVLVAAAFCAGGETGHTATTGTYA